MTDPLPDTTPFWYCDCDACTGGTCPGNAVATPAPAPAPVPVSTTVLWQQIAALGDLARDLLEAQFARVQGGRKPADPTWDELEPSERDEFREQARNAHTVFARRLLVERNEAREILKLIDYNPDGQTWRPDDATREHMAGLHVEAVEMRAARDEDRAEIDRLTAESTTAKESLGRMRANHTAVSEALWDAVGSDSGSMRGYTLVNLVEVLVAQRDDYKTQAWDRPVQHARPSHRTDPVSYLPFRDNPDLAGIPARIVPELEELSIQIDRSSLRGNHEDACACKKPDCVCLPDDWREAGSSEVLGWLYAKGLLTLPRHTDPMPEEAQN